jgi:hypothetical protein
MNKIIRQISPLPPLSPPDKKVNSNSRKGGGGIPSKLEVLSPPIELKSTLKFARVEVVEMSEIFFRLYLAQSYKQAEATFE